MKQLKNMNIKELVEFYSSNFDYSYKSKNQIEKRYWKIKEAINLVLESCPLNLIIWQNNFIVITDYLIDNKKEFYSFLDKYNLYIDSMHYHIVNKKQENYYIIRVG